MENELVHVPVTHITDAMTRCVSCTCTRDVGIRCRKEFARYRLLRVPFVGVPRAVIRDRHAGRRGARGGASPGSDAGRLLQASGRHLAGEVSGSRGDVG